jgi:hypothetical protein
VSETLGTTAERLRVQTALGLTDMPVQLVLLNPSAVETLSQARKRVRQADAKIRQDLIATVSERLSHEPEVEEMWLVAEEPSIVIALVSKDEVSLDRELELRAIFAELTREHDAELRIYAEDAGRANLARAGTRLQAHG